MHGETVKFTYTYLSTDVILVRDINELKGN